MPSFASLVDYWTNPATAGRAGATLVLAIAAIWLIAYCVRLRSRLARRMAANPSAFKTTSSPQLGRATFWLLVIASVIGVAWLALKIWGVNFTLPDSEAGGVMRLVGRSLIIVILAAAASELVSFGSKLLVSRIARRKGDRRRMAKLRTVTPLISGLANAVIVFAAASMILSEVGVEIAPLIAGAGVVGIAIGFGAQTLVKDLFTGMFLILEDIVSHGDQVEISGVSGTVEAMTLRTIRLRDYDGVVHIFPYGEAQVIHNKTVGHSYFAFDLQISYLSSIDDALAAVQQAGDDVQNDEKASRSILSPLELAGVDRLGDNGVIIKGRIRTIAGEQGKVGPIFLKAVKRRLDDAGVIIAYRQTPIAPFDAIRDLALEGQIHKTDGDARRGAEH